MRKFLFATPVLGLLISPAFGADVMVGYYGNTIISTGGAFEIRTHYRADHTFDFVGSMMFMRRTFKGTWIVDDKGNLCRTFVGNVPPGTPNPICAPIAPHKVGDTWRSKDNERKLILAAGIQ